MAYLNCPFCPSQALQSLRTPSRFPACGVVLFVCISGHKFYVDGASVGAEETNLGIAAVWHQGSRSYYRAQLLKKLTPEEAELDPTEENQTVWKTTDDKTIRRIKDAMQHLEVED